MLNLCKKKVKNERIDFNKINKKFFIRKNGKDRAYNVVVVFYNNKRFCSKDHRK